MSHRSHSTYNRGSISRLYNETAEELTDAELVKQVIDLKHQVKVLTLENEIIEKTIMRLDPALMHGLQQAYEYATKLRSSSSLIAGSFVKSKNSTFGLMDSTGASPSRMMTSPSKASTRRIDSCARIGGTVVIGTGPRINVLERSELVSCEMEILINVLEKARNRAAKKHALLKAQLEEIGIREVDFEKSTKAFHDEVTVAGWDKIAQRIPAEVWIRFMTEWIKTCDSQIGKLRLRTSTLNTQYIRMNSQIRVKTELSESLRPVDFEKLKIENNECIDTIERKLAQLEELKKMTGDANLNLTIHKKALFEQNTYLSNVLKSIKTKDVQKVALEKESEAIEEQANSLAKKLADVRQVRQAYEVPDIMDYVMVKSEMTDLKHNIKILQNRVHIQEIALDSINKQLQSMFRGKL